MPFAETARSNAAAEEAEGIAPAPAPCGLLEAVTDGRACGWAHDPCSPGERLTIEILVDGEQVAETIADLPRPSLLAEGIGDGRHGFIVELPPRLCDGSTHTISVRRASGESLPIAPGFSSSVSLATEWADTTFTGPDSDPARLRLRLRPCEELRLPRRTLEDGFTAREGPETIVLAPETAVELPELRFALQPGVADPLAERRMRHESARSYAVPPLVASRLPGAIVDTDTFLIMPDEHRYMVDSLRHSGTLLRWGYERLGERVLQREAPEIQERAERVVVLGAQSNSNYSHWLVESVARALLFSPLDDGTRAFLTPPLLDWQRETLELIGIDSERILKLPRQGPVRFREVIAVSRGMGPMPTLRPGGVEALANLAPASGARRRRIYCSRRAVRYRHVTNEGEVAALLEHHGFQTVCPEQLSIAEQIELFASAEAVLALHGSALTNILFSAPRTPVIELQAEQFNPGGIPWNWILASLRRQPFTQVVCPLADTLHHLPHASRDITVDVPHLDELLRGVLAG